MSKVSNHSERRAWMKGELLIYKTGRGFSYNASGPPANRWAKDVVEAADKAIERMMQPAQREGS